MSKTANYDVIIDGKGYVHKMRKVRIGGVEYEQKDNEYPLKFIVEKSDLMIMLESHCAIPDIHRKIVAKTGEHIAKMVVEFYGGWTPEVARLCDQKNTRTIIFIAEKPETAQLEIPIEEPETTRHWLLNNEYREMCFRNNKHIQFVMRYETFDDEVHDGRVHFVHDAISDEPYERVCYESDSWYDFIPDDKTDFLEGTVSQFTLPKTDPVKEQEHYDALRKSNNPQAVTPEPEKKPETKLKDFAKSLEVKTPESGPQTKPEKEEPKKVVYKEVTPTAESVKPKVTTPNPEKKTYKKTG